MTEPEVSRHIEVKDGDQTVADADVSASAQSQGTARASLRAAAGHIAPGSRASLVDAVMDLPEVRESSRLEAAVPLGDSESLERLRQRADEVTTRPAGSTALVDATVPPVDESKDPPRQPDSQSSADD
jgi:RecB family exonuclease